MIKSTWKPPEEIKLSLGGAGRVTIISCGTCANLSGTGGYAGIRYMKGLCDQWGIEVAAARCLAACCPEDAMREALRKDAGHLSSSDALVVLSCSGGVKSAFLCSPGVPVVAALDTAGSVPVSHSADRVAGSLCRFCEHCVLSFTGGICPLGECPAKRLYGPCEKYSTGGGKCVIDPERECVWIEIERRGDLAALMRLEEMHRSDTFERPPVPGLKPSPRSIRRTAGWFVSSLRGWHRLSRLIH